MKTHKFKDIPVESVFAIPSGNFILPGLYKKLVHKAASNTNCEAHVLTKPECDGRGGVKFVFMPDDMDVIRCLDVADDVTQLLAP